MDSSKAFNYEQGQFICHSYAKLGIDICDTLDDLIDLLSEQIKNIPVLAGWTPLKNGGSSDNDSWHVTLLRGHRALYRHQIKALISLIEAECKSVEPFNLCLDVLDVFYNFERTKQFLVIAERPSSHSKAGLEALKHVLKTSIDKFAIKLTGEDETRDTRAHCSLLARDLAQDPLSEEADSEKTVQLVEKLCLENIDKVPVCVARVDMIHIKVGNHVYDIRLGL